MFYLFGVRITQVYRTYKVMKYIWNDLGMNEIAASLVYVYFQEC